MKPPLTDQADARLVILQLRKPASDYEAIIPAAKRSYRSAHEEALFRFAAIVRHRARQHRGRVMSVDVSAARRRKRPRRPGRYSVRLRERQIGFVAWNSQRAQAFMMDGEGLGDTFPSLDAGAGAVEDEWKLGCGHARGQR